NAGIVCHQRSRITSPATSLGDRKIDTGLLLDDINHFLNGEAPAVAAVQYSGLTATCHIIERHYVRLGQIFHMDVVTDTGAITGFIICSEHTHAITLPGNTFTGYFDQMRGFGSCLPQHT